MSISRTMIKMIYNNAGLCKGLENGWGLSVWIENEDEATLFDTGADASILENNIENLHLDLSKLKRIIISHDHWDHAGGLSMILKKLNRKTDVYVTANTAEDYSVKYPEANIIAVYDPVQICNGIWTTGAFETSYKGDELHEQSLILTKNKSMILLTGCSHPGIVKIAKKAKEIHPDKKLSLVAGGFHLMRETKKIAAEVSEELKIMDIEKVAPSHCTGDESVEIFKENWGEKFVEMNIGDDIYF